MLCPIQDFKHDFWELILQCIHWKYPCFSSRKPIALQQAMCTLKGLIQPTWQRWRGGSGVYILRGRIAIVSFLDMLQPPKLSSKSDKEALQVKICMALQDWANTQQSYKCHFNTKNTCNSGICAGKIAHVHCSSKKQNLMVVIFQTNPKACKLSW